MRYTYVYVLLFPKLLQHNKYNPKKRYINTLVNMKAVNKREMGRPENGATESSMEKDVVKQGLCPYATNP